MTTAAPLLLVGCGKMGGALLSGWIDRGVDPRTVHIVEPNPETASTLARDFGVGVAADRGSLPAALAPALVMFAVKPQVMPDVVPAYSDLVAPGTVFLSIAAGKPVSFFEAHLGAAAAVVRAMPNTPAAVRRGATVCCANGNVDDDQQRLCHDLLSAVGEVHWVDDEALINPVTAVSGSGPAYVFHLVECLAAAGRQAGLPDDLADALARATVTGAGELLYQAVESPAVLRQNVTSPGGTTAAALDVLMAENGLQDLMTRAVAAADKRARELAE